MCIKKNIYIRLLGGSITGIVLHSTIPAIAVEIMLFNLLQSRLLLGWRFYCVNPTVIKWNVKNQNKGAPRRRLHEVILFSLTLKRSPIDKLKSSSSVDIAKLV